MKKLGLFIVIMMAFLILPFSVLADKNTSSNDDAKSSEESNSNEETKLEEVKVYFFHGDGCPHCADAQEFFDSIENNYGHLFEIVAYETWYDADNAALLEQIGELRDETITGVPYILIGNKSWPGYASDYNDEIIEAIEDEYKIAVDERYDIMEFVDIDDSNEKEDYSNDALILIAILIVVAGVVAGVVFARKKTA